MQRFRFAKRLKISKLQGSDLGTLRKSMDIAGHVVPILGLRKNFSRATHKGAVSVSVALQRIHQPCGGITEVPVDTDHAGHYGRSAIGLARYVVVVRANECPLELRNAGWNGVVEGFDGFQAADVGWLRWR